MSPPVPAALKVSRIVLRSLVILNWLYGAVIFAILAGLFTAPHWTTTALGFGTWVESSALIPGLRFIAVLGLVAVPLNLAVLHRLLDMVDTVRRGDPFVAQNASRLQAIAWIVLAQQLLQLLVGMIARNISTPGHALHISAFSAGGWLAVVLLFVLARVFAEGTRMRDELEATV